MGSQLRVTLLAMVALALLFWCLLSLVTCLLPSLYYRIPKLGIVGVFAVVFTILPTPLTSWCFMFIAQDLAVTFVRILAVHRPFSVFFWALTFSTDDSGDLTKNQIMASSWVFFMFVRWLEAVHWSLSSTLGFIFTLVMFTFYEEGQDENGNAVMVSLAVLATRLFIFTEDDLFDLMWIKRAVVVAIALFCLFKVPALGKLVSMLLKVVVILCSFVHQFIWRGFRIGVRE
jgi:hypothetical protein